MDNVYCHVQDYNALHIILREEIMYTRGRRNTQMKKWFDLCSVRNIYLGNVTGTNIKSFYVYTPPNELLTRLFSDFVVFRDYIASGKPSEQYSHLGVWHGDFFQSPAYSEVLKTLPEDTETPPLCLSAYRYVNTVHTVSFWIIIIQRTSHDDLTEKIVLPKPPIK